MKKIVLMRTPVVTRTVRSVRENVGGGWGEIDHEELDRPVLRWDAADPAYLSQG
jgi:hypothetical protein